MKVGMVFWLLTWSAAAQAQGISNARDGSGNLIERGAATRSYPATPMANSSAVQKSPQSSSLSLARGQ
jgi:hypothetical protein